MFQRNENIDNLMKKRSNNLLWDRPKKSPKQRNVLIKKSLEGIHWKRFQFRVGNCKVFSFVAPTVSVAFVRSHVIKASSYRSNPWWNQLSKEISLSGIKFTTPNYILNVLSLPRFKSSPNWVSTVCIHLTLFMKLRVTSAGKIESGENWLPWQPSFKKNWVLRRSRYNLD